MSIRIFLASFVMVLSLTSLSFAVEPGEMLDDPVLESRAREVSAGLRCVVCQNQSIDESNAELARDMRILVRDRLLKGDSNQDVLDYMVSRYGDFVLLEPPFKMATYFLWFGPLLFVAIGCGAVFLIFRKKKSQTDVAPNNTAQTKAPSLSKDEQHRLEKLLNEDED